MAKTKVLLDTDPGSDIDDALAISYLLKKPECELLGVTTVTGPVDKRASIVEILCHAAGRNDVPIHCGRSDVLAYGPGQPACPHYDSVSGTPHRTTWEPDSAVDFLRRTIRAHPGEVTLLSVGPLSNVALLFAIDPEIPRLLKDFVSMAGVFDLKVDYEWNCGCDPVATAIVARTPRKRHSWIGLDVTTKCTLTKDQCEKQFTGKLLETVLKMAENWFKGTGQITFHDPLAAVSVFVPGIVTFDHGTVTVNPAQGQTKFEHGEGHDLVATDVDPSMFFEEYFRTVTGKA